MVLGFAIVDDAVRAEQESQRTLKDALAQAEQANLAKLECFLLLLCLHLHHL